MFIRDRGYTLDEIKNAITVKAYASFEPMLDYCVVKIPRLPFDKFISAKRTLTTQMKATGEVMSICDNFEGALMKAIRSLEQHVDLSLIHIFGCTHYPLLRSTLREIVGEKVTLVNPAYETARELKQLLAEKGLTNIQSQEEARKYQFYVSDQADKFMRFADSILPFDVNTTKKISIEEY